MARIAGVDLPRDKRIVIGLTYIFGIGNTTAQKIIEETGVSPDVRVRDLTLMTKIRSVQPLTTIKSKVTYVVK